MKIIILIFVILFFGARPVLAYSMNEEEISVMSQINNYRIKNGLTPVYQPWKTCETATIRANDMFEEFSHRRFRERIFQLYKPTLKGWRAYENLATNYEASRVVGAWIFSPTHDANLKADMTFACVKHLGRFWTFEGIKIY